MDTNSAFYCFLALNENAAFFFFFQTAIPAAHGSSQARGQIGAATGGLCPATAPQDPSRICELWLRQLRDP